MVFDLSPAEMAILGLVSEQPRHGYDLDVLIEARGLREWTEIGFSSIYFLLHKLEKKGFIRQASAPGGAKGRKLFSITTEGIEVLREQALRVIASPKPVHSPLLVAIGNWPILEAGDGLAALRSREVALRAEAKRLQEIRASQRPLPNFVNSLFEYGLVMIEAELHWINMTAPRLEKGNGKD